MKTGLTLGKYAPFHNGHRYVIETALQEVDKLIIMIYETNLINISTTHRAEWIKSIFKNHPIEVIECYKPPKEEGYTKAITDKHDKYIIDKVGNKNITHFYSSEKYGKHVSKALRAIDRRIDMNRTHISISATKIRQNSYNNKQFIPQNVYKDLICKVAFLGAESTGKTTIAQACANHFNTEYTPEYGATIWHSKNINGILSKTDLLSIAEIQCKMEDDAIPYSNKFLFCDTTPLTTYMFSIFYHNHALNSLKKICKERKYNVIFVCDNNIPFNDSNGRRSENINIEEQEKLLQLLKDRKIQYHYLTGTIQERLQQVKNTLKKQKLYIL